MAKWEYAELILTLADPDLPETKVTLHHHTDSGNIPIPITAGVVLSDPTVAPAHWDKFSKAVAKMGADDWELVSVCKYEPTDGVQEILHWFKRKVKAGK